MGTLILVRHATTAASENGRNLGQRDDPPLAERGTVLARRLATTLASELEELPHDELRVVTSPALRCRQTAAAIAAGLAFDADSIEVAPGMIEIDYGAWDGLTPEECSARDPELRAAWEADPYRNRCPDGESGADVLARVAAAMAEIEAWLTAERHRCAIVVAHNHVNRVWMSSQMGWPMRDYRTRLSQDPAGYGMVSFGSRPAVIRRVNAAPA